MTTVWASFITPGSAVFVPPLSPEISAQCEAKKRHLGGFRSRSPCRPFAPARGRMLHGPMQTSDSRGKLGRFLALELLDNRYPQLHGLRVIAILTVVQFHVTWIFAGEQGISLDG